MQDVVKIVRVFLASPSDVDAERTAARAVIEEFNPIAEHLGYRFQAVGWETLPPAFGRPQSLINPEMDRCELFLGILWKRWGTPPGGKRYSSGFHEEFETSVKRRKATGQPEICLLFKHAEAGTSEQLDSELAKVLRFKQEQRQHALQGEFRDLLEFTSTVRVILQKHLIGLAKESQTDGEPASALPSVFGQPVMLGESSTGASILGREGAGFLRRYLAKTESDTNGNPITRTDIARLRLLANASSFASDGESALSVNDAYLLYRSRGQFEFGRPELFALIESGCAHLRNENVPLWCWVKDWGGWRKNVLSLFSVSGPTETRIGAMRALTLVRGELKVSKKLNRFAIIRAWFTADDESVVVSALEYLARRGEPVDLTLIREEIARQRNKTRAPAIRALLSIEQRASRENAIDALLEFQPSVVDEHLVDAVFSEPGTIPVLKLTELLSHASSSVRLAAASSLRSLGRLSLEDAEKLKDDSDVNVRFEALLTLSATRELELGQVKSILVPQTGGLGLGMGFFGSIADKKGELLLAKFQQLQIEALSDAELEARAEREVPLQPTARLTLVDRHFSTQGQWLRDSLRDEFKTYFARSTQRLADLASGLDETFKSLEPSVRKQFMRLGLDILVRRGRADDLPLVREILLRDDFAYTDTDLRFLAKFGDWTDIDLILVVVKRQVEGLSLLALPDYAQYLVAAECIVQIGGDRLSELIQLKMPDGLRARMIAKANELTFGALTDNDIVDLFVASAPDVRKAAVLKSINCLPRKRVERLLDIFLNGRGPHFYNVIYWLDFGISLPRLRASASASAALIAMFEEAPNIAFDYRFHL